MLTEETAAVGVGSHDLNRGRWLLLMLISLIMVLFNCLLLVLLLGMQGCHTMATATIAIAVQLP